jgi:hypothetical protein
VARGKKTGGRGPKLTPEIQKVIVDAATTGTPRRYAAERAGVDESTVRRWIAKGRKLKTGIYRTFCTLLKKAEADGITARVARITKAAQGGQVIEKTTRTTTTTTKDGKQTTTTTTTEKHAPPQWTADAWMLERRCPDEFALQRKKDIQDAVKAELAKAVKNGEIKPPDQNDGATSSETPPT